MPRTLTLFIDGLPYNQLEKMPFSRGFESRGRLVPILGYSVNCQTQLFTGKSPDELGYWCEWTYDPKGAPFRKAKPLLRLASLLERSYTLKRVMHHVLDRLKVVSSTKNIPLSYLGDFSETGHTVFSPHFKQESLLDLPQVKTIFHTDFPPGEDRDERAFLAAKQHIEREDDPGDIVVTWTRIDHVSHWSGVGSEPYDEMLLENDRYIRELTELFLSKVEDGVVLVISDHGMVNVEKGVAIDLEGEFGRPSASSYAYFSEGTLLRVWSQDANLLDRIRSYLDGIEGIEAATNEDREQSGITSPGFGNLIYHCLEGYQYNPSFWGPKLSVGMHGYHPRFESQHGIALSTRAGDFDGEIGARDFYRVLSGHLGVADSE